MTKTITIGREQNNDVILDDQTVSRNHAKLYFEPDGTTYFEDLNSSNGSFVNGNRVQGKVQVQPTDILKVGKALLQWQNYLYLNPKTSDNSSSHQATVVNEPMADNSKPYGATQESSGDSNSTHDFSKTTATNINSNPDDSNPDPPLNNPKRKKFIPVLIGIGVLLALISIAVIFTQSEKPKENPDVSPAPVDSSSTFDGGGDAPLDETVKFDSDQDGDGVLDTEDKCPDKKGTKANKGCPEIDSDSDNTPDRRDNCPYEYGPAYNAGCPEIEEDRYRTQCPYCYNTSYETTTNQYWNCGSCGERFYNCYRRSVGDYGGIRIEWFNDGTCDCSNCDDE